MVCDRIKKIRTENKMTQIEFGKKLGVSRTSVNAWEMGISVPSLQILVEISKLFKVSVDYMLELDNDIKISIGHLKRDERQIILNLIKKFEKNQETIEYLRTYENLRGQMVLDISSLPPVFDEEENET